MTDSDPATALQTMLTAVEQALALGDCEAADQQMGAAAALCADLQGRGITLPSASLPDMRELAERCGAALLRARDALNAESQRDDNHRRALLTYANVGKVRTHCRGRRAVTAAAGLRRSSWSPRPTAQPGLSLGQASNTRKTPREPDGTRPATRGSRPVTGAGS